jgi:thioredoxin reductase (NADPH)
MIDQGHGNEADRLNDKLRVGDLRLPRSRFRAGRGGDVVAWYGSGVGAAGWPFTAWLPKQVRRDQWGFVLTGPDIDPHWSLGRAPSLLETSLPGVFAIGDVRHGSVKRVASAVGEGSTCIRDR